MNYEIDKFIREYFEDRPQLDPPAHSNSVGYAIPAPCLHMIESLLNERHTLRTESRKQTIEVARLTTIHGDGADDETIARMLRQEKEIERLTAEVSQLKADIETWEGTVGQLDKRLQRTKAKGGRMTAALQAVDQGSYSISERTVSLDIGVIAKVKAALTALTIANDLEIGSYRKETGLRGEYRKSEREIERLENAMREIQAATSDKVVLAITDKALCDEADEKGQGHAD